MIRKLPSEIQLEILEYVDILDIASLQLTSKSIHKLVENHGKFLWKNALRRQCIDNTLFWPTYKDLSTAAEFKCAATRPFMSTKAYQRAVDRGPHQLIPCTQSRVSFSGESLAESLEEIEDIYLIPGGRYLLSFVKGSMSMWDMLPAEASSGEASAEAAGRSARLMTRYPSGGFDNVVCISMEDCKKIVVVLSQSESLQLPNVQPVDAFFTTYIFLQIKVGESEDKEVEVDRFASLTIMHAEAEMVNVYTMLGTKVTFHATGPTDDVTVVWDYALDRHVGWRLEGISDVCEVFASDDHVFYIDSTGVHAVKMPPFTPPADSTRRVAPLFLLAQTTRAPDRSFIYPQPHTIASPEQIIGSDLRWALHGKDPVMFMVKEDLDGVFKLHRYQFTFDSNEDGKKSLELTETSQCKMKNHKDLASRPYQIFNRRMATCWAEELPDADWHAYQLFLSISSPLESRTGDVEMVEEASLIPFLGPLPLSRSAIAYEFCAATGKAAILWSDEEGDSELPYIVYYDFLQT